MKKTKLLIAALSCFIPPPALSASDAVDRAALALSMRRAVELAVSPEGNARMQLAAQSIKVAESRAAQARAALLPQLDGIVAGESETRNLATLGIPDVPIAGLRLPSAVGPFTVFDVRVSGTQNVFDLSLLRRFQSARSGIATARSEQDDTEDQVVAQVAKAYLSALRAEAGIEAAEADVALARSIRYSAGERKAAGTATGIEITRAGVQLSDALQRLLAAQNDRRRARLELLKAIGLRLDTEVVLTDTLRYVPVDAATREQAYAKALEYRADWKAQQDRERTAELAGRAVRVESLPSLASFADYGSTGRGPGNSIPTRTFGVSLRIPLFDGGRRQARRAEAAAQLRQERIRASDLKERMALETSVALDSLRSADAQLKVAEEGLGLAEQEVTQARQRYEAGVTGSVELTDAQARLQRARENRINALYQYNQARLELGQSTGTIRQMLP